MFARHSLLLSLSTVILVLGACAPDAPLEPDTPPVLSLSPSVATIDAGGTLQLTVTVRDADGNLLTPAFIQWSSSNLDVARLVGPGTVRGQAEGRAWIGAFWEGAYDAVEVNVLQQTEPCPGRPEPLAAGAVPCPVPWSRP